jgi:hypothetical protein
VVNRTSTVADPFRDDLLASLFAWRKVPALPILTLVLAAGSAVTVPPHDNFGIFLAGLLLGLFSLGWFGTQFIWYRRAFDGQPANLGELFPLTWSFIARYLRLYLLALTPLLVLVLVGIRWHPFTFESPGWRMGVLLYILVCNVAATFVNPILAFSTRKVSQAVPIGLYMIAHGWPRNWKYVLVPGVAAAALGGSYWLAPLPIRQVPEILIALVSLVFAGAIARFYLRDPLRPLDAQVGVQ